MKCSPNEGPFDCRVTVNYEFVSMGFLPYDISLSMQNEYRPFNEIEFDFTTSLSKEAAVMAMLGWMKKPYREVSEAEYDYRHRVDCELPVSEEEEIMFERHSPSLLEVLREIKESADSEYTDTKIDDPLDEDALAESLANIKKSHELIETAHKFYCDIADELAKGDCSALRLDQYATKNLEDPYITLTSLADWAFRKYNITLFKLTKPVTFDDLGFSQQEIIESLSNDPGDTSYLQLTLALLVEAFSQTASKFKKGDDSPNASAIATEMELKIPKRDDLIKLSKRNIEEYIGIALKKKRGQISKNKSMTSKTLNLCLALLVEVFAGKIDHYQDSEKNPNVQAIAEHLALQAADLPEQNRAQIASRIADALLFKENPDRRPSL